MNGLMQNSHGQSTWDMLWQTMIANRTSSLTNLATPAGYFTYHIIQVLAQYKANFGADALFTSTLARLQQFQAMNDIKEPTEFIINFVAEILQGGVQVAEAEPIEKGHLTFAMLSGEVSIRRRLFRTSNGHLGLGPLSLRRPDEIWLMDGAHYPFLLRETDDDVFTFVGELYLHGHMSGEMLQNGLRDRFRSVRVE